MVNVSITGYYQHYGRQLQLLTTYTIEKKNEINFLSFLPFVPCTIVGHPVVIGCREVAKRKKKLYGDKGKTNHHPSRFNFNLLLLLLF